MTAHRIHAFSSREVRFAWAASRRVGDHTAVFYPGDELLCPGTRIQSGGVPTVCSESLNSFVKPGTQVVVRVQRASTHPLPHAGTDYRCRNCRSTLEIFPILEATG
jgi:hypothetical protein